MSEVRTKLFEMVAAAEPRPNLVWRMTPIAFCKIQMAEERTGDLLVIVANVRPLCIGIPVELMTPRVYKASEIALGDGPTVTL